MAFRILVVEDDPATRRGMVALLAGAGYEAVDAGSMAEAQEQITEAPPDLIVADLRLGEFNGLYLAAVNPSRIPVVIVTGYFDRGLEAEARELGADFLIKPVRPSQLLAVIERRLPARTDGQDFVLARRWPRRRPSNELSARVDNTLVRIVDLSYGGLCLSGHRNAAALDRPSFQITLPKASVSVPVRVVWQQHNDASRLCGARVPEEWQPQWRQLVDALA